jgi:hypothetical protein
MSKNIRFTLEIQNWLIVNQSNPCHSLILQMPHRNQDKTYQGIQDQYLTREKDGIYKTEQQQQYEPPHIAIPEIFSPHLTIMMLQIESKAKK